MKVGMDDPSSVEFVERRRAALERQASIHVSYSDIINLMLINNHTVPCMQMSFQGLVNLISTRAYVFVFVM